MYNCGFGLLLWIPVVSEGSAKKGPTSTKKEAHLSKEKAHLSKENAHLNKNSVDSGVLRWIPVDSGILP